MKSSSCSSSERKRGDSFRNVRSRTFRVSLLRQRSPDTSSKRYTIRKYNKNGQFELQLFVFYILLFVFPLISFASAVVVRPSAGLVKQTVAQMHTFNGFWKKVQTMHSDMESMTEVGNKYILREQDKVQRFIGMAKGRVMNAQFVNFFTENMRQLEVSPAGRVFKNQWIQCLARSMIRIIHEVYITDQIVPKNIQALVLYMKFVAKTLQLSFPKIKHEIAVMNIALTAAASQKHAFVEDALITTAAHLRSKDIVYKTISHGLQMQHHVMSKISSPAYRALIIVFQEISVTIVRDKNIDKMARIFANYVQQFSLSDPENTELFYN